MALIRVAQYNSTPTVVEDYQAQNAHLQAFTNQLLTQQFILDSGTAQPVIKQGAYVSHGGSLYVADADTSITGSPSDGSVYIRVSGSTSLTVEFINNISGYAWNPVYSALTSGSYTLLPYLIVKASTVWTRYNFNPNNQSFGDTRLNSLGVTGAISGASVAVTGNATVGGTLGVTGAISGATINTGGLGAFLIGQNLRQYDSPTFAGLTIGSWATRRLTYKSFPAKTFTNTYIDAMEVGEIRVCIFPYAENNIFTPSGGQYFVAGYYTVGGTAYGAGLMSANNPKGAFFPFSGGEKIANDVPGGDPVQNAKFVIVRIA